MISSSSMTRTDPLRRMTACSNTRRGLHRREPRVRLHRLEAQRESRALPRGALALNRGIVLTDDAVLLAHKTQAQKIKDLVRKLSEDPKLKKLV